MYEIMLGPHVINAVMLYMCFHCLQIPFIVLSIHAPLLFYVENSLNFPLLWYFFSFFLLVGFNVIAIQSPEVLQNLLNASLLPRTNYNHLLIITILK